MHKLVLASTSRYRAALLERLGLPFKQMAPEFAERKHGDEPLALVRENTLGKALAVASRVPEAMVIASDQVAVFDGAIIGKPGTEAAAIEQLLRFRGRSVEFLTGVALAGNNDLRYAVVPTRVHFRMLDESMVRNYVRRERPLDCAGSFRAEGLGIALFTRIESEDPTALIGLPLIQLSGWLQPLAG